MGDYRKTHAASLADAGRFWEKAAEEIDWYERWETALDQSRAPFTQWFKGATLNTCYNALDRHVDGGRGEQIALIYDSPVTDKVQRYTYRVLRDYVAECAVVGVADALKGEVPLRLLVLQSGPTLTG